MDPQVFIDKELGQLESLAGEYKERGWRLVNVCGSSVGNQIELLYSFSQHEELENIRILVDNGQVVPAVSPLFPNAFVFENEARDLYGVEFEGVIVDFGGHFYGPSVPTPMNPSSAAAKEYLKTAPVAEEAPAPNVEEEADRG